MPIFDTHFHLFDSRYQKNKTLNEKVILQHARDHKVQWLCNVGINLETSQKCVNQAHQYKELYAAVGYHPSYANQWNNQSRTELEKLLQQKKVIAIGEIGLDYYHDFTSPELQKKVLHQQIQLALKYNLPVLLHIREAYLDTIAIVKQYPQLRGIVHCFSGYLDDALVFLKLGFYISFSGTLTFKNAHNLHDTAARIPLNRIVVETDAPYLSPVPYRGKINLPGYIQHTVSKLATIKNMAVKEVIKITTQNAQTVFKLK